MNNKNLKYRPNYLLPELRYIL